MTYNSVQNLSFRFMKIEWRGQYTVTFLTKKVTIYLICMTKITIYLIIYRNQSWFCVGGVDPLSYIGNDGGGVSARIECRGKV